MNAGKKSSQPDEHNTNQNEAASNVVRLSNKLDLITTEQKPVQTVVDDNLHSDNVNKTSDTIKEVSPKSSTVMSDTAIPSIVIEPASPKVNPEKDTVNEEEESSVNNVNSRVNSSSLCLPKTDSTINVSRPLEDGSKHSIDTSNDEDLEVICRCSSTPIKNENKISLDDNEVNCSVSSIETSIDNSPSCMDTDQKTSPSKTMSRLAAESPMSIEVENTIRLNKPQNKKDGHASLNENATHDNSMPDLSIPVSHITSQPLVYDISRNKTTMTHNPFIRHDNDITASISNVMYTQHGFNHGGVSFNDYYPATDNSWTDMSCRSDMSLMNPMTSGMTSDNFGYAMNSTGQSSGMYEPDNFVYPSILAML